MNKSINDIFYELRKRFLQVTQRMCYPSDEQVAELFSNRDEASIMKRIQDKETINVAFFCMSTSLWKYETLFQSMLDDKRFNPIFFISPKMDVYKAMKKEVRMMKKYCKEKNYPCVNLKNCFFYIGHEISNYYIDIAFYSQPYTRISCREYYYDKMKDALLCYTPYGYLISKMKHNYVSILNLIAWKNYLPTSESYNIALDFNPSYTNLYDYGYLGYDMYNSCKEYIWGKEGTKRIIWSPHYSIGNGWIKLSYFLDISDYMVELAKKYSDTISFAFKPHPYLYPTLCKNWGRKRTDEYYRLWDTMPNCVLYNGNGYELMKSSDAMIHDCASFLLDYMYTQKPCLYVSFSGHLNVESGIDGINAYDAHYHAKEKGEIESFIKEVVLNGNDELKHARRAVLEKHIIKAGYQSATSRIMNDLTISLYN